MMESMTVLSNKQLTSNVYECVLSGELVNHIKQPGQFVQVQVDGVYLRRPISIATYNRKEQSMTLIYKVIGKGTNTLSTYQIGMNVNCLGPLGNGFDVTTGSVQDAEHIVLCGGGIGVPPLYGLLQHLFQTYPTKKYTIIAGFQTASDAFYHQEFQQLGAVQTLYVSEDGNLHPQLQNVIETLAMLDDISYLFTCGPNGMLDAITAQYPTLPMQLSLEERMACGVGVCMGCVKLDPTVKNGYIRLCKDGPVVRKEVNLCHD